MPAKKRFEVWGRDANGELELLGTVDKLAKADGYARECAGSDEIKSVRIEDTKGEMTPREYSLGNG